MKEMWCATGRRKSSVARVRIKKGDGKFIINGKEMDSYMGGRITLKFISEEALSLSEYNGKLDVVINVYGGGKCGQAGAIRHGIARALILLDPELRPKLKKYGLITRDPRVKERKKYGQKGARAKFQFSKR